MSPKTIISNIQQFALIAVKNPAILQLSGFIQLKDILAKSAKPSSGCRCKRGKDLGTYRPQFEMAFSILSSEEQEKLKILLDTKELCYYRKDDKGQIKLTCF